MSQEGILMKKRKKIISSFIILALFCSVMLPLSAGGDVDVPTWNEGDSWAMQHESSIDTLFAPGLQEIEDDLIEEILDEEEFEMEDFDMDISGDFKITVIQEVSEVGEENYVLDIEITVEASSSLSFEVTMDMPEEGEEPEEVELRTITMSGSVSFQMEITGETVLTKSDLAMVSAQYDQDMIVTGNIQVNNVPDLEKMDEDIIEYTDYNIGIEVTMETELDMSYDPPLDMFNFPIEEGSWGVSSTVTTTGKSTRTMDLTGLPANLREEMEEDMGEELPITEVEEIDEQEDIDQEVICTGTETLVLPNGETVEVYVLELETTGGSNQEDPQFVMFYSPEHGNIIEATVCFANTEMEEFMTSDEIRLQSVDVSDLEDDDDDDEDMIPFVSTAIVLIAVIAAVMISTVLKESE